jgi:hypothetical protein
MRTFRSEAFLGTFGLGLIDPCPTLAVFYIKIWEEISAKKQKKMP